MQRHRMKDAHMQERGEESVRERENGDETRPRGHRFHTVSCQK